ncbi:MAG: cytochrome C biogenesis protein [Candidatus Zixiibacteriota bacterium]|nr:MAG: cytochrome C biogenesis protein [candidate division Zixibacteria bacterium]
MTGMWWKILAGVVMAGVIVASFVTPAPQQQIGEASRIFYYHIPQAWVSVLAFTMSMVFSIRYLRSKSPIEDDRAAAAAGLGLVFCFMATVTGAIFAKETWGSYWNWDPRETTVFVLLLIYAAYLALRNAVEDEEKRAALSAVYSIFAFATVPLLIFIIPRIMPSLHPSDSIVDANFKFQMDGIVALILSGSVIMFTVLFLWMFNLSCRTRSLVRKQYEEDF